MYSELISCLLDSTSSLGLIPQVVAAVMTLTLSFANETCARLRAKGRAIDCRLDLQFCILTDFCACCWLSSALRMVVGLRHPPTHGSPCFKLQAMERQKHWLIDICAGPRCSRCMECALKQVSHHSNDSDI